MKNSIILILVVLFSKSFATHNRAGEITYKRIPPFVTGIGTNTVAVYNYSITLIRYTDDGMSIADRCEDTLFFGDGQKAAVSRINGGNFCGCPSSFCGEIVINEVGYRVKKNIYTSIHTYTLPGTYTVSVLDPNRNQGVQNIPNSVNVPFYVESVIVINPNYAPNSSPILTNMPVDKGYVNTCYYHNPGAFDEDGDSLSYQIVTCKIGAGQTIPGFYNPPFGTGGTFNIDVNGLVTWCTPQLQGEFNFAFKISEWRKMNCNGAYQLIGSVTRDTQALIGASGASNVLINFLSDTCVIAGVPFSRNVTISTLSTSSLSINLIGSSSNTINSPIGSFNPTTGTGTFVSAFSWNTSCNQAGNQTNTVLFSVSDNSNLRQKKYADFRFKVVPPSPQITSVNTTTGQVTLTWKKINVCNNLIKGYNIYRKNSPNSWSHSPCETGAPAYSGFYPIGFNLPGDTTFNDNNMWQINNGSVGNYIVTTVLNDCSESFADTIKTIFYIVGIKENKKLNLDIDIYPNPIINTINIDFPGGVPELTEIELFSPDGKLILKQSSMLYEHNSIRIPFIHPGLYLLYLKSENGLLVKKLVKE